MKANSGSRNRIHKRESAVSMMHIGKAPLSKTSGFKDGFSGNISSDNEIP